MGAILCLYYQEIIFPRGKLSPQIDKTQIANNKTRRTTTNSHGKQLTNGKTANKITPTTTVTKQQKQTIQQHERSKRTTAAYGIL